MSTTEVTKGNFVNARDVTIEWGDCDPAGIVFYPRYFAMFDTSTAAMIAAALGMSKPKILRHYAILGWPMVDTRGRFMIPNSFGDTVRIETSATELRRSSFDVTHRLLRDGALSVECTETRVWVARDPENPDRIRSLPIPDELRARLAGAA
jgi:4-hydroxybenzoyl-CoA thioesterase